MNGSDVNFTLFSEMATSIELCSVSETGEESRIELGRC